jgi:4-hydroxy-tetrahydrodipicolinate synthase
VCLFVWSLWRSALGKEASTAKTINNAKAIKADTDFGKGECTMALTVNSGGLFPIAPTPFLPDGAVDWASLSKLMRHYVKIGADGVTVLGIMGEAPKLEPQEALRIVRTTARIMGDRPVIVGVSAPGFAAMRSLAREAMAAGAAGVMIAPPYTARTDDQIVGYYAQAIEAIGKDIPFVIQDYPLITSVVMTANVIRRIVMDNPSCVMLKAEDWPGLEKITTLRQWQKEGSLRPLSILVANGGLFLDFEMERGADGSNTGYAFPEMLSDVVRLQKAGERDKAHDLFDAHLPLLRYEQQPGVGLAVRKYVMMRRGLLAHDTLRKPAANLTAKAREEVDYLLSRLTKKDRRARLKDRT